MATVIQLESADHEFFQFVAQIAFCNPFSEQRQLLDAKIIGHPVEPLSETHLKELSQLVSGRIAQLEAKGGATVRNFTGPDQELMRIAFLFEIYHRYYNPMDELIEEQTRLGAESAAVKFADEVLQQLHVRGFTPAEALRFLAIFYQLRRAYHFIVSGLAGRSPCMNAFRRHLWNNVFTHDIQLYDRYLWNRMEDFSTLLLGETGTGKGTAAAAIGRSGYIPFDAKQGRFAESFMRSFVSLNLSQAPESLIEAELFGHRKGAFTGAVEAHQGVLARCSPHGAIFLDEIGDVSVPVQIKLLQVLQERTFCPVGSHEPVRFCGRVIAATNRPLEGLRGQSLFRDDFFYRLCSDIIEVPPLRQRLREHPGEFTQLIAHLLSGMLGQPAPELVDMIQQNLRHSLSSDYAWPGNVRELEQAIRRILLINNYTASQAPKTPSWQEQLNAGMQAGTLNAEALLAGYCSLLYDRHRNYEAVARITNLDRRTVKKYVQANGRPG